MVRRREHTEAFTDFSIGCASGQAQHRERIASRRRRGGAFCGSPPRGTRSVASAWSVIEKFACRNRLGMRGDAIERPHRMEGDGGVIELKQPLEPSQALSAQGAVNLALGDESTPNQHFTGLALGIVRLVREGDRELAGRGLTSAKQDVPDARHRRRRLDIRDQSRAKEDAMTASRDRPRATLVQLKRSTRARPVEHAQQVSEG
jgi:hypothetical protein